MAALVASPIYLPSRDNSDSSRPQSSSAGASMFSLAQSSEQGLSRFTSNPINFVKASEPAPTSVPLSSKYEILDDSKLDVSKSSSVSSKPSRFIGPLLPPGHASHEEQSPTAELPPVASTSTSHPTSPSADPTDTPQQRLWTGEILNTFPVLTGGKKNANIARGLDNVGNTCFLNSVLQCLLHTPQLLQVAVQHFRESKLCKDRFCMIHSFAETAWTALYAADQKSYVRPTPVLSHLGQIAKSFRRGRQEDAHEFLRYTIDAFQRAALFGTDPKLPHSVKETTWVHKLFGGRLRSRVTCQVCKHNSDTFDSLLDLSIDIFKKGTLRDALNAFVAVERLAGADKYNCEKCKKAVVAEKRFTIHDAPQILTVHLKRFSPTGRKLTNPIQYGEDLSLARYMSDGQFGPNYSLYGVISHAGGGPHSGHYYAHVKSAKGVWHEMNDESVTPVARAPLNLKNAYILFYMRTAGSSLQSAIHSTSTSEDPQSSLLAAPAEIFSSKDRLDKRKRTIAQDDNDEEDLGVKAVSSQESFSLKRQKMASPPIALSDPAAIALKAKIIAASANGSAKKPSGVPLLAEYDGQSSEAEDVGVSLGPGPSTSPNGPSSSTTAIISSPTLDPPSTPARPPAPLSRALLKDIFPDASPAGQSKSATPPPGSPVLASISANPDVSSPPATDAERPINTGIPPEQFYGNKSNDRKGKHGHSSDENDRHYSGGKRRSGDWRDRDRDRESHPGDNRHFKQSRDKPRWKVNGGNAFSASMLRGNLHEDRSGPSNYGGRGGNGSFSGAAESKKNRMNKRKRSLI